MGRPGKFEGCSDQAIGERLHEMTLDGCDDEHGDVQEYGGWHGLLLNTGIEGAEHAVVSEDGDGFFDYEAFATAREAEVRYHDVTAAIDEEREELEREARCEARDVGRDDLDSGDELIDGVGFADPGGRSSLRAATPDNPRDRPCPTCGAKDALTRIDVERGYQCDRCADRAEGRWAGGEY